ncbi:MAG TPA: hypothetical protein VG738_00220 [Chitinophagaceae bacterium]|nr:hypothetical protein [Chitinophagaceae bacterium]
MGRRGQGRTRRAVGSALNFFASFFFQEKKEEGDKNLLCSFGLTQKNQKVKAAEKWLKICSPGYNEIAPSFE